MVYLLLKLFICSFLIPLFNYLCFLSFLALIFHLFFHSLFYQFLLFFLSFLSNILFFFEYVSKEDAFSKELMKAVSF